MDTSAITNALANMPEDIHESLWRRVSELLESGKIAVTTEIYDEMLHIRGDVGVCINGCRNNLKLEVGQDGWDWNSYLSHSLRMSDVYRDFISEYNNNRRRTVGLIDISIIALGKTVSLPVVSLEDKTQQLGVRRRIPDICEAENITHMTFSDFLRAERVKV